MKTIYETIIALGLGLNAKVKIEDMGPADAPATGVDWPVEKDYPIVVLTIALPTNENWHLVEALRASDVKVLGEMLGTTWGVRGEEADGDSSEDRIKTASETRSTVRESCEVLRLRAEADLAAVRAHVDARVARLARRERTIAAARQVAS